MEESRSSRGVGSLAFSLIPAALGGAALTWLLFVGGCMDLDSQQKQAKRMADRVGIHEEQKAPVKLLLKDSGCVKIDQGYIDTDTVTLYMTNGCSTSRYYTGVRIVYRAPDGTVINSDTAYLTDSDKWPSHERIEKRFTVHYDERTAQIEAVADGGRGPYTSIGEQ